jgi:hypothetical protein
VLAGALAHRKPRQKSSGKKVLDEASSLQARRLCVTEQSMNTARPDAAPTGSRELIYGLAAALMQPFLRFCAKAQTKPTGEKRAKTMLQDEQRHFQKNFCIYLVIIVQS